ncbi:TRAP transporter small permease [uncultured Sulfitobacter sp.]|uniref:TRAP transporter small permease n=1 Tax=uncultured Sulfitobacter sp. TaxID=191468 RepID=UPI0026141086|nr:TRAP transporter small permease [uncultured Sulfitobacter sp.]
MLRGIEKLVRRTVLLLGWLAAVLLAAIMGLTFVDVIGRNFLGRSVLGTVETVSLMMGALVFCGLAVTELHRRHIVVETFQGIFPKPVRRISVIANSALAVGVSWLLLEQLFVKTVSVFTEGEFTMILKLPYWPASILMLVGLALFFVLLVLRLIREITGQEGPIDAD